MIFGLELNASYVSLSSRFCVNWHACLLLIDLGPINYIHSSNLSQVKSGWSASPSGVPSHTRAVTKSLREKRVSLVKLQKIESALEDRQPTSKLCSILLFPMTSSVSKYFVTQFLFWCIQLEACGSIFWPVWDEKKSSYFENDRVAKFSQKIERFQNSKSEWHKLTRISLGH
jgi:hypothetical protein